MTHPRDRQPDPESQPARRREPRVGTNLRARTATIDPVFDPVSGASFFHSSEDDAVVNLSRRGARLRCCQPPDVGTRLLLQIDTPDSASPIELIARTRWTRVEFESGTNAGRAVAAVGIEVVGGSRQALERFDRTLERLSKDSVATPEGVG